MQNWKTQAYQRKSKCEETEDRCHKQLEGRTNWRCTKDPEEGKLANPGSPSTLNQLRSLHPQKGWVNAPSFFEQKMRLWMCFLFFFFFFLTNKGRRKKKMQAKEKTN